MAVAGGVGVSVAAGAGVGVPACVGVGVVALIKHSLPPDSPSVADPRGASTCLAPSGGGGGRKRKAEAPA